VAQRTLDRNGPPLWTQLLADLRARLAYGEFVDAFPGELALVEAYAVSRHTVREALRHLRSEGLVTASRGRKPQVRTPEVEQQIGALTGLFAAIEASGLTHRAVVRTLDVRADGTVATQLGLEESTPLVHLERLRLAGEEPLAVDRVWLPADVARPLLGVDFSRTALYDELFARCGVRVTGGTEQVRAVTGSAAERRLLGLPDDQALLLIERTGRCGDRPVEHRRTLVRGDRYALTSVFGTGSRQADG